MLLLLVLLVLAMAIYREKRVLCYTINPAIPPSELWRERLLRDVTSVRHDIFIFAPLANCTVSLGVRIHVCVCVCV